MSLIHKVTQKKFYYFNKKLWISIGAIFTLINIFYFTNILPPLPLAMRDSGIFNQISKKDTDYFVSRNHINPIVKFFDNTILVNPNSSLYYFSSIFSPAKLNTKIYHEWDYYDPNNKKWNQVTLIGFPIYGGRELGYRGYSLKQNPKEGEWRVITKTQNGQVIGLEKFTVKFTNEKIALESKIK